MSLTANRCIIFVSAKRKCEQLYKIASRFFSCTYVYSDLKQRKENIAAFREKKYRFLISTTVMERGITIPEVSVIILHYDGVFDEGNLVQMLGRVGRGVGYEEGRSYLFCAYKDRQVRKTVAYLKEANSHL